VGNATGCQGESPVATTRLRPTLSTSNLLRSSGKFLSSPQLKNEKKNPKINPYRVQHTPPILRSCITSHNRLNPQPNPLVQNLLLPHLPDNPPRRLKRLWPRDLIQQQECRHWSEFFTLKFTGCPNCTVVNYKVVKKK
jgi:hypothetical protein